MIHIKKQSTGLNLQKNTKLLDPIYSDIMSFYEFPNSVSHVDCMVEGERDTFQYSPSHFHHYHQIHPTVMNHSSSSVSK